MAKGEQIVLLFFDMNALIYTKSYFVYNYIILSFTMGFSMII